MTLDITSLDALKGIGGLAMAFAVQYFLNRFVAKPKNDRQMVVNFALSMTAVGFGAYGMYSLSWVVYAIPTLRDFAGVVAGMAFLLYGLLLRRENTFQNAMLTLVLGGAVLVCSLGTAFVRPFAADQQLIAVLALILVDAIYQNPQTFKGLLAQTVSTSFFPVIMPALILICVGLMQQLPVLKLWAF